jgi:hypothetical protein
MNILSSFIGYEWIIIAPQELFIPSKAKDFVKERFTGNSVMFTFGGWFVIYPRISRENHGSNPRS